MNFKLPKILSAALLCLILLSACGAKNDLKAAGNQNNSTKGKPVTIAASFYPMYIMAINVAKDMPDVKVIDMTKPQPDACMITR